MISWEYTKQISWEYTSRYPDSPGTCTLSKTTSEVLDPLIPSLSSLGLVVNLDTSCGHRDIFSNISLITSWQFAPEPCVLPCTSLVKSWFWVICKVFNKPSRQWRQWCREHRRPGWSWRRPPSHQHPVHWWSRTCGRSTGSGLLWERERERERISNLHTISSLFKH